MFHLSRSNLLAAASHNQVLLLFFIWFLGKIRKKPAISLLKMSFFDPCSIGSSNKKHAAYSLYEWWHLCDTRCKQRVRKGVIFFKSLAEMHWSLIKSFFFLLHMRHLIKIKQDIFLCLIVTFLMCLNQELNEIQDI